MKKVFFFEKRTKKLLRPGLGGAATPSPTDKSLLLLFFRKEDLTFYGLASLP
jgi:hypothetical protein